MGLFDGKHTQANAVSPEVAECDRQLAALEQRKMNTIFRIGQIYVENNDSKSAANTIYEECMKDMDKMAEEKVILEKRKLAVQGLRKCEKCGNILVLDSAFCNKCGEKLEALFTPSAQNPNICTKCGTPYEEGTLFCTSCGNKIE